MFYLYTTSNFFSKTFTTHQSIPQMWSLLTICTAVTFIQATISHLNCFSGFLLSCIPHLQCSLLHTISIGILLKHCFDFVPPMSSQFTQRNGNLYDGLSGWHSLAVSSPISHYWILLAMLPTILSSFLFCEHIMHAHNAVYALSLPSEVLCTQLFIHLAYFLLQASAQISTVQGDLDWPLYIKLAAPL